MAAQETPYVPEFLKKKTKIKHLHNSFLDTSVNYGLVGLLLLVILIAYMLYIARKAYQMKKLSYEMLLFFYCFMAYWLVVNLFESYMYYSTGNYIFGIVCGVILTHYWRKEPIHIAPEKDQRTHLP